MWNCHTIIVAYWGASLSTLLFLVRVYDEYEKRRLRIEIAGSSFGTPELDDLLDIRNFGSKPIILTYWELISLSGIWPRREEQFLTDAGHGYPTYGDIQIGAQESHRVELDCKLPTRTAAYVRLRIAGRNKPILKKIRM